LRLLCLSAAGCCALQLLVVQLSCLQVQLRSLSDTALAIQFAFTVWDNMYLLCLSVADCCALQLFLVQLVLQLRLLSDTVLPEVQLRLLRLSAANCCSCQQLVRGKERKRLFLWRSFVEITLCCLYKLSESRGMWSAFEAHVDGMVVGDLPCHPPGQLTTEQGVVGCCSWLSEKSVCVVRSSFRPNTRLFSFQCAGY